MSNQGYYVWNDDDEMFILFPLLRLSICDAKHPRTFRPMHLLLSHCKYTTKINIWNKQINRFDVLHKWNRFENNFICFAGKRNVVWHGWPSIYRNIRFLRDYSLFPASFCAHKITVLTLNLLPNRSRMFCMAILWKWIRDSFDSVHARKLRTKPNPPISFSSEYKNDANIETK